MISIFDEIQYWLSKIASLINNFLTYCSKSTVADLLFNAKNLKQLFRVIKISIAKVFAVAYAVDFKTEESKNYWCYSKSDRFTFSRFYLYKMILQFINFCFICLKVSFFCWMAYSKNS